MKLRDLKLKLKSWNSRVFGLIDENIAALENKIQELDSAANLRALDSTKIQERKQAQLDLWQWLKIKETY